LVHDPKGDANMPSKAQYWRCQDCDAISETKELLRAPSPFGRPDDEVIGCPKCKGIEGFDPNCDYPGCRQNVSGGHPMPDGDYLNRCWQHSPANPAFTAQAGVTRMGRDAESGSVAEGDSTRSEGCAHA
jgi:hypothetical protein